MSFLKAMYGPAATKENDYAFHYLPKIDRNYSWVNIWNDMYEGKVKGLFAFGMNGVMIGPDSQKNIDALKKADWLVVCEIYPDETSEFWRAPGISTDEMKQINTTVYRLPGAGFAEKDGTFVNSARWLQWKNVAVPPPGQCRLDQEILATIFLKVRELYKKDGGKFPDPVLNAAFAYTDPYNPSLTEVAKEINGKALADITDPKTNVTIKAGHRDSGVQASAPIVPIQPNGTKPAIICIGALNGEVILFRRLALELGQDQPLYGLQPFSLVDRLSTVETLAASYIDQLRHMGRAPTVLPARLFLWRIGGRGDGPAVEKTRSRAALGGAHRRLLHGGL